MKMWASCTCILNYKSAAPGPIWLKFGQIVVGQLIYKNLSGNFNSSFHFKVIAYFPLVMAIISHPRIYLLVKIKRTHIPEI